MRSRVRALSYEPPSCPEPSLNLLGLQALRRLGLSLTLQLKYRSNWSSPIFSKPFTGNTLKAIRDTLANDSSRLELSNWAR